MYTVKFKDGTKDLKTNDIIKVVEAVVNLKREDFEIIESVKKGNKQNKEQSREQFIASLNLAQSNDVNTGVKEVRYTTKLDEDGNPIGWYLRVNIVRKESHVSIEEQLNLKEEKITSLLKSCIRMFKKNVITTTLMNYNTDDKNEFHKATQEEISNIFEKIIK